MRGHRRRSAGARVAVCLVALALVSTGSRAYAQSCDGGGRYTVQPQPRVVDLPDPGPADFALGWIEAEPFQIQLRPRGKAYRGWDLCVRALTPDLGGPGKPLDHLEWMAVGRTGWRPLSPVDQLVATGDRGERLSIRVRARLDLAGDDPGRYGTVLLFTAGER